MTTLAEELDLLAQEQAEARAEREEQARLAALDDERPWQEDLCWDVYHGDCDDLPGWF